MKRMNLRDVPDDVYLELARAAEDSRQSLNAFVVARLVEAARVARLTDYVTSYPAPSGTGISIKDSVAAVKDAREAS